MTKYKYHYKVDFQDSVYLTYCTAEGNVRADTMSEAYEKISLFYPNITSFTLTPTNSAETEEENEWDL